MRIFRMIKRYIKYHIGPKDIIYSEKDINFLPKDIMEFDKFVIFVASDGTLYKKPTGIIKHLEKRIEV